MPSGPKKRRAARRKRGSGANHTEEELEDAVELSESLSKVLEKSSSDTKAESVGEAGSKGSQSVDQIALESPPPIVESEHEDKSKDVQDEITMVESESKHVDQNLIDQPSSKEVGEADEGASHGAMFSVVKEGEEISKERVAEDPVEEPTHAVQNGQDSCVPAESISEVNVAETFVKDAQDSLKEQPGTSSLVDLSLNHEDECVEVGESTWHGSPAMVVSVVQNEGEDVSMEGVGEDPFEEPVGSSSHEPQDPSAPTKPVIEVDLETIEDGQDSLGSSSLVYMFVAKDHGPLEMVYYDVSVVKEGEELCIEVGLEDCLVLSSSLEREEMVKTDVQSVLNEKAQDPSFDHSVLNEEAQNPLVDQLVIEVDADTISFEDAQDSFGTPLGSPSMGFVSPRFNGSFDKPIQGSLHDPHVIPLNEAQDSSLSAEPVYDVNVHTHSEEVQDSINEPLESSSMADLSSVEGVSEGNEFGKGGEYVYSDSTTMVDNVESVVKENEEMPMEGAFKESFVLAKSESVTEANTETHSKDVIDSLEEPAGSLSLTTRVVQENGCAVGECACDCPLVNFVVAEGEKMSLEGVLQAPFKEPIENSSHEPQEMVDTIDQSIPKAINLKETHDPSLSEVDQVNGEVTYVEGVVLGNECDKVGDIARLDSPVIVNHVPILMENEDMCIDNVHKEQNGHSSDELQETNKAFLSAEESSFKVPLGGSIHVTKGNVYGEDRESATLENPFVLGMEDDEEISVEGVLEKPFEDLTEPSLHEPQEMVNTVDQVVLMKINLEEAQDLGESVMKYSFSTKGDNHDESAYHGTTSVVNQGMSILEDGKFSTEIILEEPLEKSAELLLLSGEVEEIVKKVDLLVSEENTETSLKDSQDSLKEPMERASLDDVLVSSLEGDVKGNIFVEVGESGSHIVAVVKDAEEMSMEGVLQDPLEEVIESSFDELDTMVKTDHEFDLKVIPSKETQLSPLPIDSDIEVKVEKSFKDIEENEGGENTYHGSPEMINRVVSEGVLEDDGQMSTEGVLEDPFEEPSEISSHEPQEMVLKELHLKEAQDPSLLVDSDLVIKVNVDTSFEDAQESFETPLGSPSVGHMSPVEGSAEWNEKTGEPPLEPHVKVKTVDQVVSKVIHVEESSEPSLIVESIIDANTETPLKDAKDQSSMESIGSFSMDNVSSMEDVVQGNEYDGVSERSFHGEVVSMEGVLEEPLKEPTEPSSDELQTMVKTFDQSIQDPSTQPESYFEENVETSFKDNQDFLKESPVSPFMVYESPFEGVVEETKCGDNPTMVNHVESLKKEDEDLSIEGVVEETFKEPIGPSSDELQTIVKTVDQQSLQDPSIPYESDFEANVETSIKDNQDSLKEPSLIPSMVYASPIEGVIEEKTCSGSGENATMANHVESLKKEKEDLSLEGVLEESIKEPIEHSSNEQQTTANTVDMLTSKEIPLKEAEDPSVPVESLIQVSVETSFRDVQEFVPLGTSMVNHGSSSLVNGSLVEGVGQRNGQRNDMVGLVRSLLEEIRRIRAFYEEGLRQTTQIDMQMLQILEKFDSGKQF